MQPAELSAVVPIVSSPLLSLPRSRAARFGEALRVCLSLLVLGLLLGFGPGSALYMAQAQNIYTAAGTGTAGYNSDNIAAMAANLRKPTGVAVDGSGNLYIADFNNHRIRKVDTAGIITTVAGNGTPGYNNDNIAATGANLNYPRVPISIIPRAWPWMGVATSTLPTLLTIAFARWIPLASSRRWRATALRAITTIISRPRVPISIIPGCQSQLSPGRGRGWGWQPLHCRRF